MHINITFSLISFDIERAGFDNLFMTTEFNEIYDDCTESWTCNIYLLDYISFNQVHGIKIFE